MTFLQGAIEQAISAHPSITESCVVPIPDHLKGHMPFAFAATSSPASSLSPPELLKDLNSRIRHSIGPIATLGGVIVAPGIIPKTRSGKTLRRVLRQIVENAFNNKYDGEVNVPATVEDAGVVEKAKDIVRQYFEEGNGKKLKAKL